MLGEKNIKIEKENIQVGIIGAGVMGQLYAHKIQEAGWNVNICDLPERFEIIQKQFQGSGVNVLENGHLVSRRSDFIIYSVETEFIDSVVQQYGPSTKFGAIVGGQTSVKQPEIEAFEKHLPEDISIVTCHSLHGPNVDPTDQPLIIINYRGDQTKYDLVYRILESLNSKVIPLTWQEHDRITADTQAATHLAFESMGTAWKTGGIVPWENPAYIDGIGNVKVNLALRIYSNKWHVYAGIAIFNSYARAQIKQYGESVSTLYQLIISEKELEFRERICRAKEFIFGNGRENRYIELPQDILNEFSLSTVPKTDKRPNSNLSLFAMVDCWYNMKINPYDHLICQTPLFRLWLGIIEYSFRDEETLEMGIQTALYDRQIRTHDLAYYLATLGWAQCIEHSNMDSYKKRFMDTAAFFETKLSEANTLSSLMINFLESRRND
ncbi:prephenate dehydrogenase (NADP(+)) [Basidiobolus ranarum]|uniref:Prephenate dehydrogenase (NADP(+)) n=1 Tax=Basidiobolus ranarum TaxID=34480 RepID=A0ABR2VP39_9FUNG